MSVLSQVVGLAGMRAAKTVTSRMISRGGWVPDILPQGRVIAGAASRDTSNTGLTNRLQAGLLMGKISTVINSLGTVGYYAPSVIGVTGGALANGGTSLTIAAAVATEITRRIGATGNITLLGPPAANGTARSATVAYSAVGATTLTITAPSANEVQRINFNIASTGGTVTLIVPTAAGVMQTTTAASYSATDATYLSAIQTVLDVATGVVNGIVVSAIPSVDTDLGFVLTYSGTGYAGLPQPLAQVTGTLPTSSTTWNVTRTTTGVSGAFVAGSLIGSTDGSQVPLTFVPNGTPIIVTDYDGNNLDVEFAEMPIDCVVDETQILPVWPSDTGLQAFIKNSLSTAAGGKFIFNATF